MQDLIYKNGQAGVNKATVTINFDNSDKNQSPVGYETCREITISRQIVVGGKNKYMINGKNAQNKQVHDLFCTVQLNINNPNFLIMQGRITKVLNMKPPEILSMIEEAAGTSTYENKKEKSLSLIQKKDSKLDDLKALINEEIKPKLDKLRKDQQTYEEYTKICRDVDYLTRIHISYTYLQSVKNIENCETNIAKLNDDIENHKETIQNNIEEVGEIEKKIAEIQEVKDLVRFHFVNFIRSMEINSFLKIIFKESGGELKRLEEEQSQINQRDAKTKAHINSLEAEVVSDKRKYKTLEKNNSIDENALKKKNDINDKTCEIHETLKKQQADDLIAFQTAQKNVEAVNLGMALNDEGETTSLQEQLTTAKSKISDATSTIKKSEMELKYSKQSLDTKQKNIKSNDESYIKDKQVIDNTDKEIKNVENQLKSTNYEEGQMEEMTSKRENLNRELRQIRSDMDRNGKFEFRYDNPIPNWNPNRVRGLVSELFRVKDSKYTRALSAAIGGGWANVVIDNDETGKLLLERGNLQRRTTFVPLNKIQPSSPMDDRVIQRAQSLVGRENAIPALELIEYDRQYDVVMKNYFGRCFIVKDLEVGKKVTYDNQIRMRSYTLDGDQLDPGGSMSGGAVERALPVLDEAAKYNNMKLLREEKQNQISQLTRDIENTTNISNIYKSLRDKLDNLQTHLNAAKNRMKSTTFQQEQDEIDELKAKIVKLEDTIKECKETKAHNEAKVRDLEVRVQDFTGNRDRAIKIAEDALKIAKQKHDKSSNEWKKREKEYETLQMEIKELTKTLEVGENQKKELKEKINENEQKIVELKNDAEYRKRENEIQEKIRVQKEVIQAQHKEIRSKNARKDKLLKNNSELELEIKKKENDIKKVRADNTEGYNKIQHLEDKYPWIPDDKAHFGAKNTRYDYSKEDPVNAGKKLKTMMESKEKLSRNINQEAMMLLEREEEHYNKIMKREGKIRNDRQKLMDGIKHMDEEKVKNLEKAWERVNANFGSIFSTLLPGAQAKLVPPAGKSFMSGLEVKIGFNNQWKETLTELSGGQRSLVALSLILAMLKYKPAPLYILDEVDAALDLSHTQNIGAMLKAHFKNSQFVIVSLKDGMFNNANVLFRTKFVDGVSGVIRTVNKH